MTDRFTAMRVFQRVAQLGNLSRAARDLGLSQPSVSRIVADLERDLGAVLFVRSTRALRLTDQGSDYLTRIEAILGAVEEADRSVRGTGELRGALRVGVSTSLSVREIIPRLPEFLDRHPALRIELSIGDQLHDLITDGVDLALRAGRFRTRASSLERSRKRRGSWWRRRAISPEPVVRFRQASWHRSASSSAPGPGKGR